MIIYVISYSTVAPFEDMAEALNQLKTLGSAKAKTSVFPGRE